MKSDLQEDCVSRRSHLDLDRWMERYQQADPDAPATLIAALSPSLLRFFRSQGGNREHADDLLQDTWLRIHRVRHTYRPGEPVLPWVYAIARRAGVDGYRKARRIAAHETRMDSVAEGTAAEDPVGRLPAFDVLVSILPASEREVITMLKAGGLTLEEVARATSSSVGAVKQRAHRAYERLRKSLRPEAASGLVRGIR
jgi:RNA polymerase sigma-70 factor, ECF subfamily